MAKRQRKKPDPKSNEPKPSTNKNQKSGNMKIGDLAKRTGISRQALHQYVLLGLLEPAAKTKGGQRMFPPDAVERVKLIRSLCDNGYTLREIRTTFFHG